MTSVIRDIRVDNLDPSGNLVLNVLAKGNEYAIYEIETTVPENRLRVLIDGIDDKREKWLTDRFNLVKQNYVLAKGLLYRSRDFNLMKNRIAHALASTLSSNGPKPNSIFTDLINEIRNEYKEVIWRRFIFLTPGYTLLLILAGNMIFNLYFPNYLGNDTLTQVLKFSSGAVIGGVLSMTYSLRKYIFETEPSRWFYLLLGWERISLALLAGVVVFIGMKTGFIFGEVITSNYFASLFVGVGAGFFETVIPNLLRKQLTEK